LIRKVSFFFAAALLATFGSARAQQPQPKTKFEKQLDRVDLGVSAAGLFNSTVAGTVDPKGTAANIGTTVSDEPSNTVGELVNLRYIARPMFGLELNFVNARYTENYSYPPPTFGVQTGVREFSFGYLVTPKQTIFSLHPFLSAGMGTTEFKPTAHGGEGLPVKARATYYYSLGVQDDLSPHFGLRVAFRQAFFLAPDFGQNYLTILQHTSSYEPTAGFYLRF